METGEGRFARGQEGGGSMRGLGHARLIQTITYRLAPYKQSNLEQLQTGLNRLSIVTTSGKHLQGPFKANSFSYSIDMAFLG